jgi:nitrogen fixation NifU-like protein
VSGAGADSHSGSTAFRAIVLEHFKHPKNRGALANATVSVAGANPLCGDRIRVELRVDDGVIADARFTADACAISIATASMLTEGIKGRALTEVSDFDSAWVERALEGPPPAARARCVTLVLDTLRRAAEQARR